MADEMIIPLPPSAQEIADVIGRERALLLIGQLPQAGRRKWRVVLYIPKRIDPDHNLVRLIGWEDAMRLVRHFGGEILQPSNCRFLPRAFRDAEIIRLWRAGEKLPLIADKFDLSYRQVRNIIVAAEMTPEDATPAL